jgi:hypothetical protein
LTAIGLGGLLASSGFAARPASAAEAAVMVVTSIAELRAETNPDPTAIYYVADRGQEGPFYFDPADKKTVDNTGLVLVSSGGARFKRIFDGPVRIGWFGAVPDYNTAAGAGTPCDDALDAAFAALQSFAVLGPPPGGPRMGMPTIAFEAGNYLLTGKKHGPFWGRALMGIHLVGQGIAQTNIYFDCPEDVNGTDNYLLFNDGTATTNNGVTNGTYVDGISFRGVSGTERFLYYADTPGGGTAKHLYFRQCAWSGMKAGIDIGGRVNSDLIRFFQCEISVPAGGTFLNVDNPQSQLHEFVDCNYSAESGTVFNYTAGGALHIVGGEITTTGTGVFLRIDDPTGARVGIGNGVYTLTDINPEIRDAGMLLQLNAPEAHVTFVDPRFVTGHGNYAKDWVNGQAYAIGDTVRDGPAASKSKQPVYQCIAAHTAGVGNEPRVGADWAEYWQPLYEMRIDAGEVKIRGGQTCYTILLTYGNDSYASALMRPVLTFTDGCRLVNPLAELVDITPTETITNSASMPQVTATGCLPYTGAAPAAYAVTPTDPVDVTLNPAFGYSGATLPRNTFVFRASPVAGEGLPAAGDEPASFLLPRGAHVIGMQVVGPDDLEPRAYQVASADGSRHFLPERPDLSGRHVWYAIDTEEKRKFVLTSTAKRRVDGFIAVEYV